MLNHEQIVHRPLESLSLNYSSLALVAKNAMGERFSVFLWSCKNKILSYTQYHSSRCNVVRSGEMLLQINESPDPKPTEVNERFTIDFNVL